MASDFALNMGLDSSDFTKNWTKAVKTGEVGASKLTTAIGGIGTAFTLLSGPIGIAAAAIAGIVTGIKTMIGLDETVNKSVALFGYWANTIGMTGDALLNQLKPGVEGLISNLELMRVTTDSLALGINKDAIPAMVKFANANKKAGQTTLGAMEDLIGGLGRGSTELLDNLGIQIKAAQAQEIYAKSLGITRRELTEVQKAEAIRVVATDMIIKRTDSMGDSVRTVSDQWKKWGNTVKNFGLYIYRNVLVPMFNGFTKFIMILESELHKLGRIIGAVGGAAAKAMKFQFSAASEIIKQGQADAAKIEADTMARIKRIDEAARKQSEAMSGLSEVAGNRSNDSAFQGETPGEFYGRTEKASYGGSGSSSSSSSGAAADAAEEERQASEEQRKLIERLKERDKIIEEDRDRRRRRDMDDHMYKITKLNEWFEEELELRQSHNLDTDALEAEYDEKKAEIMAEKRELEKEALIAHQEEVLELKSTFFEQADDLFISYADNQANIAAYLDSVRKGELSNEQMFQSAYNSLLSNLPKIAGDNGKKLVAVMKGIEAAKGIIATYSGAAQAMATLPFPANIAAAASIVGTGLGYVAQIGAAMGTIGGSSSVSSADTGKTEVSNSYSDYKDSKSAAANMDTSKDAGTLTINIMGDFVGENEYVDLLAQRISDAVSSRNVVLKASEARTINN